MWSVWPSWVREEALQCAATVTGKMLDHAEGTLQACLGQQSPMRGRVAGCSSRATQWRQSCIGTYIPAAQAGEHILPELGRVAPSTGCTKTFQVRAASLTGEVFDCAIGPCLANSGGTTRRAALSLLAFPVRCRNPGRRASEPRERWRQGANATNAWSVPSRQFVAVLHEGIA